jgi:putative acetyltransferase
MEIMNYDIQPAKKDHYNELIQVWEASVRATHHFLQPGDIEHYKPLILEQYFDQLQLYHVSQSGRIQGFIGLDQTHIQMLFIHPQARGLGIGKALLNFAIDQHDTTEVEVNEQNQQAFAFYQYMGFETVARADYDAEGKPYPILSMKLNPQTKLRAASPEDTQAIIQLYQQTILEVCSDYDSMQRQAWAALGSDPERWKKRISEQHFLVAEFAGKIQGFASITTGGHIDVFYIHKDQQRKGIASLLFQALETCAAQQNNSTLTADVSKSARLFFEKQGFSLIKVQQNHLQGQVLENYHMQKSLTI